MDTTKFSKLILLFVATVFLFSSCGKAKRVTGEVLDEAGQPLADVFVKIENSTFETKTKTDGSYAIDYVPGEFKIIFSKDGYIGDTLLLKISEKQHFPAETIRMFDIPDEKAIYLLTNSGYLKLARAAVTETVYETGRYFDKKYNRVFLSRGEPTVVEQNDCTFLDFDPENQYLIRVNNRGEIGKIVTVMMGLVESTSFNTVQEKYNQISKECWKRVVSLTPGLYVFVPFKATNYGYNIPAKHCYYFKIVTKGETQDNKITEK